MTNEEVERLSVMTGVPVSEIQKKMAKAGLQDEDFLEKSRSKKSRPTSRQIPLPEGSGDGTGEPPVPPVPSTLGSGDGTGQPPVPPVPLPLPEVDGTGEPPVPPMPRVSRQAPSGGNRRPDRGVEGQRPWFGNSKSLFHRIMRWVLWKITGEKGPNKTSDDEVLNASERMSASRRENGVPGSSKGPQHPFAPNENPFVAVPVGMRYDANANGGTGRYVRNKRGKERVSEIGPVSGEQQLPPVSESSSPRPHQGPDVHTFLRSITESQVAMAIRYLSFRKSYGQPMPTIYLSKSLVAEIQNEFSVTTHELIEEFKDNNIEIKVKE